MKRRFVLFLLLPCLLASCNKTNELYPGNAYDTGVFDLNYYTEHNNVDKVKVSEEHSYTSTKSFFTNPSFGKRLDGVLDEDQSYVNDKGEKVYYEWNIDTPIVDKGVGFGPSNNLTGIDEKFAYGILSKLYDGRVRCDGYYAQSRVQLSQYGFSTFFPKELISAKYFGISIRGGTSCNGFSYANANIDFHFQFLHHTAGTSIYKKYIVDINDVDLPTNNGGSTSLLGCYFSDVFGEKYADIVKGFIGFTLTYDLNEMKPKDVGDFVKYGYPTADNKDPDNPHFSVMLYELMIPKSTWR